jgi:hypothetical protein
LYTTIPHSGNRYGNRVGSGVVSVVRPGGWFALVVRVGRVNRFGSNPHKITGQAVRVGQGIGSGQGLENSCDLTKLGQGSGVGLPVTTQPPAGVRSLGQVRRLGRLLNC